MAIHPKPIVLLILDGWGLAPEGAGNSISQAKTPNMTKFWNEYVHTQLIAHGESVGLPKREPGNTETGHLNLGAGRIVYQDLPRINMSIADGSFFQNPALVSAIKHVKTNNSALHLFGLVGGGGVHSDLSHFFAILRLCHEQTLTKVFLHLFTDGRDSPPTASMVYIKQLQTVIQREGVGKIASVMGRYYAMDRDFRWDRVAKAYFCLTTGAGKTAKNIEEAISNSYASNQTDEFIEPTVIHENGVPLKRVQDNDAVIFVNFRIDRPRELTKAFVLPDFDSHANQTSFDPYYVKYHQRHEADQFDSGKQRPFSRPNLLKNLLFVTMTEYDKNLPVTVAFPPQTISTPLGKVLSDNGLRQLRLAESEKERFVTYYFNGMQEANFPGEDRIIIPSPKVPTYDKKPEMAVNEITDRLVSEINKQTYDVIIVNFANSDMVGHTGNLAACIKACEAVDLCLGQISEAILHTGGVLLITADHGNAEEMINVSTGAVDTEHNANPVPFLIVGNDYHQAKTIPQGILADVAPTLLSILKIPAPLDMSGRYLLANLS